MSDFRIRYGTSFGPYGTAAATSSLHLIPYSDTTPDVSEGTFFVTANTSATAITYFDMGGVDVTARNGKVIFILFQDNLTQILNGTQVFQSDTGAAFTSGGVVGFIHYNSGWYQFIRSENTRESVKTLSVGGTVAPNVDSGVRMLILSATAATTLISFSGGEIGQSLDVLVNTSNVVTVTTGGNIAIAGTSDVIMNASGAYRFVLPAGTRWYMERPVA